MTARDKTGLPCKVHLDVEYDMALDFLKTDHILDLSGTSLFRRHTILWLPRYSYLTHLLFNGTSPKIGSSFLINRERLLYCLRHFNPELVGRSEIPRLHLGNNPISFPQYIVNPPFECRLLGDPVCHSVLSNLNRVRILDVL